MGEEQRQFYVSHHLPEALPREGLRNVEFFTTNVQAGNGAVFYMGFSSGRRFFSKSVKQQVTSGALLSLSKPYQKIERNEGVWLDTEGRVVIADYTNPFDDPNRRVICESQDRIERLRRIKFS